MDELSRWIFGLPDDAVKSDIVELLEHTDEKLQADFEHTGRYPETPPASTPTWLIAYKKPRRLSTFSTNKRCFGLP